MRYTKQQLIKKYKGKFVDVYGYYNYKKQCWEFEVRGTSKVLRENFDLPEDAVAGYN